MKNVILGAATLLFFSNAFAEKMDRPNIIFMMLDDMGHEWVGAYGADEVKTPNIDRLAETGLQFNGVYSMPKCTPTRVTLLTGKYPYGHGWVNHWDVPRRSPRKEDPENAFFDWEYNMSMARIMKSRGYVTAAAGKWQINDFRYQPLAMEKHGFDEWRMWTGAEDGTPGAANRYGDPYINTRLDGDETSKSEKLKGEFGPKVFTDFIIDFMGRHKDKPMFIYYPEVLPHTPYVYTPLKNKGSKQVAMVEYVDHLVGRLTSALDSLGIRKNTIFFFTTDNGSTRGLKTTFHGGIPIVGGKEQPTENGSFEPFIVNGPGIVPVGKTNILADFTDMIPTFAELAGAKLPENVEFHGQSMAKVLTGESTTGKRTWQMTMGGGKSVFVKGVGIRNAKPAAQRMMRDHNFKVYVDLNKEGTAFEIKSIHRVDSIPENSEGKDLLNDKSPEVVAAIAKFNAIIDSLKMPVEDHWAMYRFSKAKDMPKEKLKYDPVVDTTDQTVGAFPIQKSRENYFDLSYSHEGIRIVIHHDARHGRLELINTSGQMVSQLASGRMAAGQVFQKSEKLQLGVYQIRYTSELGTLSKTLFAQW